MIRPAAGVTEPMTSEKASRVRWLHWLAWAALATSLGSQLADGAETLRWKFKPGETLRFTMAMSSTQTMNAMGQEFKTTLSQTVDFHWDVKSVSDETAELTQTIDRVRTRIEAPGAGVFEFDSNAEKAAEGPFAELLSPLLKALVGAEFSFKMNSRGELSEIKVSPKLLDSLRQAGPMANAGGLFSEEGLKNVISQSSLTLPAEPMEKGKTWSSQSKVPVPMIGTMVLDKTYTYEGSDSAQPGRTRIRLTTRVGFEPSPDSEIKMAIKSSEGRGDFEFDAEGGRILGSRVQDRIRLQLTIQDQVVDQFTETETNLTLN
jgi:hypothetical protein